jgi:hypothetical protein
MLILFRCFCNLEVAEEFSKGLDARIKSLLYRDASSNLIHCSQCTYSSQYSSAVKDHIEAKGRLHLGSVHIFCRVYLM